jgi:plasmid stability protein
MATLNIRNLPELLYKKLQTRAERERRAVAREVTHLLSDALDAGTLSLLDLRGLGKEHWRDIDPAAHVKQERDTWD